MYHYYAITPTNTDGEYQATIGSELTDEEYTEEVLGAVLIDGENELPEDAEDIRGCVHSRESLDIYVRETEEGIEYFGIKES